MAISKDKIQKLPDSFRLGECFQELFFLDPVSAYPIGMWLPQFLELTDSLTGDNRDFLFAHYGQQIDIFSAAELRQKKYSLIEEIRSSEYFKNISRLIDEYEEYLFCDFDHMGRCSRCQRSKNDSFSAPLCSACILKFSFQEGVDESINRLWTRTLPEDEAFEEFESDPDEDIPELDESQVEAIMAYFGMERSSKKLGSLYSDALFHGNHVIIWRRQIIFDELAAEAVLELIGETPVIVVVSERFLSDVQLPNLTILSYSDSIFEGGGSPKVLTEIP